MTQDDRLNLIRTRCIEAIEGIEMGKDPENAAAERLTVRYYRPIRLVDLLLAFDMDFGKDVRGYRNLGDSIAKHAVVEGILSNILKLWNLRADDLREQSNETVNFIYELLK